MGGGDGGYTAPDASFAALGGGGMLMGGGDGGYIEPVAPCCGCCRSQGQRPLATREEWAPMPHFAAVGDARRAGAARRRYL